MTTNGTMFASSQLEQPAPERIAELNLPRRQSFHPSAADWRDQVLYFLLVDRFSDGREKERPLLDPAQRALARPPSCDGQPWRWDKWAKSGANRYQGGTLKGVQSQLDYLQGLGITAIWLSPVFKQRSHLDTYHGYGIQDYLDIDPRFGTRQDLVELVQVAHKRGIRIVLDIIFNHTGSNWDYPGGERMPDYRAFPGFYPFGEFLDGKGQPVAGAMSRDDGVWPLELQAPENYTRAGSGDLGAGSLEKPHAEHKRTDFFDLRDLALDVPGVLTRLVECFKYWIALTDCDGFRIDTLKHVSFEEGRNFCGAIKEYAANLGKEDFLLLGEIAGGDFAQDRYLDVLGSNLNAALDIGEMRQALNGVAKGLEPASRYFDGFDPGSAQMGSHRSVGKHHVSICDDHDHVLGDKIRFSSEAASDHQVVVGVAMQLYTLGIPCLYYGTEQALAGPEATQREFLPSWKTSDRYLREAMFGPKHPRAAGAGGKRGAALDTDLPGFGPFGTAGAHCFDENSPSYRRIAKLCAVRGQFPALRKGRQYLRPVSLFHRPFTSLGPGELIAWSRILSDEEVLCVVNPHGSESRGGDVLVDKSLSPPGSHLVVVVNTRLASNGSHAAGSILEVQQRDGVAFVEIRGLAASEVLVLVNRA